MLGLNRDDDLLLGREEIADYLGVSKWTLSRKMKGPNPPPVYKPFIELRAYKTELKEWTKQFPA